MRLRSTRVPILAAGVVCLALIVFFGVRLWRYYQNHVTTDDAYVAADVALVTPRLDGTVVEIAVEDNRRVRAGDLLVRLDPADPRLRVQQAEAALAAAERTVEADRAQVHAADSDTILAEAELEQAQRDSARVEQLARKRVVSSDDFDRARTALRVAQARLEAARQAAKRARAVLGIAIDAPAATAPAVRQAIAERDLAALALSFTELRAPISGVVVDRTIQLGQHVASGQPLMRLVPLHAVYIEANFKETQLARVRIGQPVSIVADMYPGVVYRGVVDSLAPGTGSAFALLPPENATGNWIKVVQRLPVRIRLAEPPPADHSLRVGLSVEATIDIGHAP